MLRPLGSRVLVELEPHVEQIGLLYVPDTGHRFARILRVGPGVKDLAPGDRICFPEARLISRVDRAITAVLAAHDARPLALLERRDALFICDDNVKHCWVVPKDP